MTAGSRTCSRRRTGRRSPSRSSGAPRSTLTTPTGRNGTQPLGFDARDAHDGRTGERRAVDMSIQRQGARSNRRLRFRLGVSEPRARRPEARGAPPQRSNARRKLGHSAPLQCLFGQLVVNIGTISAGSEQVRAARGALLKTAVGLNPPRVRISRPPHNRDTRRPLPSGNVGRSRVDMEGGALGLNPLTTP